MKIYYVDEDLDLLHVGLESKNRTDWKTTITVTTTTKQILAQYRKELLIIRVVKKNWTNFFTNSTFPSLVVFWKWKSLSHVWLFATPWTIAHGILQAKILEWVPFPFSRGFSQPRNWTGVSCIAGRFFTNWAIREAQESKRLCVRITWRQKISLDNH